MLASFEDIDRRILENRIKELEDAKARGDIEGVKRNRKALQHAWEGTHEEFPEVADEFRDRAIGALSGTEEMLDRADGIIE